MARPEAENALEGLRTSIAAYRKLDTTDVARREQLGALHLGDATFSVQRVNAVLERVERLMGTSPDVFGAQASGAIRGQVDQARGALQELHAFTPGAVSNQTPEAYRAELLRRFEECANGLVVTVLQQLGFDLLVQSEATGGIVERTKALDEASGIVAMRMQELGAQALENEKVLEAARAAQKDAEAAREAALEAREESAKVLAGMRLDAGKLGVEEHGVTFDGLAAGHEKSARRWLAVTTVLVVVLVGGGTALSYFWHPGEKLSEIAQGIAVRAVTLSGIYYALVVAVRNYRAHRHLAVVNAHRRTALKTFNAFVKSAADDATKNAVLLEVTRSIFSAGASGYLPAQGEDDNPSRIVEILRLASGKSPPGPGGSA